MKTSFYRRKLKHSDLSCFQMCYNLNYVKVMKEGSTLNRFIGENWPFLHILIKSISNKSLLVEADLC